MNNLRFLNHVILFSIYPTLLKSQKYSRYLSWYRFFPTPPGVEYMNARNMNVDLGGPWHMEPTAYPMPSMPDTPVTFGEAADEFGHEMCQQIDQGKHIYLMWSGGIDSTSTAVSILKNLQPHQQDRLHIICSDMSKNENPMFYHKFLAQFDQIELCAFEPAKLDLANLIVIDGEGGDQTFGSSAANKIFSIYPDKINQPWRSNIDFLRNYWYSDQVPEFYDMFMETMQLTIDQGSAPVESLFDFFWWLNFNFKFDSVMFRHTLRLSENIPDQDFKYFATQVCRRMFATNKMQQWSMSAGAGEKISTAKKTVKWAGRKYIYEFDHNEYYFREKRKEFSSEVVADSLARYIAVDQDYQRHSIFARATRQNIGDLFYPAPKNIPIGSTGMHVPIDRAPLWINDIS